MSDEQPRSSQRAIPLEPKRVTFNVVTTFGKELFDRIEIGGIFRQEEQAAAGLAHGGRDRRGLVRAEMSMMTTSPAYTSRTS